MRIISVRKKTEYKDLAIRYFQQCWSSVLPVIYEDCIAHSIGARNDLPQWYLLEKEDEKYRGNAYVTLLFDQAKADTARAGYDHLYLSTSHVGY